MLDRARLKNVYDMKGVHQGDVEDFLEFKVTDEPVEGRCIPLRSKNINIATAHNQFPDFAASIIKWQKGTQDAGRRNQQCSLLEVRARHHTQR